MNETPLPDDLLDLENRLRRRLADGPPAELRARILHSVARELAAREWGWQWIAAAAVVLLVLNISMISASRNQFSTGPSSGVNPIVSELQALQTIDAQQDRNFK